MTRRVERSGGGTGCHAALRLGWLLDARSLAEMSAWLLWNLDADE